MASIWHPVKKASPAKTITSPPITSCVCVCVRVCERERMCCVFVGVSYLIGKRYQDDLHTRKQNMHTHPHTHTHENVL